jgi:tetratricopeptide (TPR) repeat protein
MLETIREYAAEKLVGRGEEQQIAGAHARYFFALAEEVRPNLTGPDQKAWFRRLDVDLDNLRAAMRWLLDRGDIEAELQMASALGRYWYNRAYWSEARRWLEGGLDRGQQVGDAARARAHQVLGELARNQSDFDRAERHLGEALILSARVGDEATRAHSLLALGAVMSDRGEYKQAAPIFEESLQLYRRLGEERGAASALASLGVLADRQGDGKVAKKHLEEALTIHRRRGDGAAVAHTLNNLGYLTMQLGDLEEAHVYLEQSLTTARALGDRWTTNHVLDSLGDLEVRRGEYGRAEECLREGLKLNRELKDRRVTMALLGNMARLEAGKGNMDRATRLGGAQASLVAASRTGVQESFDFELDKALAHARKALGEEGFQRAWQQGEAMNLEAAIAFALHESEQQTLKLTPSTS